MGAFRWLWLGLALAACAVVALAGGLSLSYLGPPDPRTASRDALVRWLAVGDVASQPSEVQDGFVDRLASELRTDADFGDVGRATATQREQLTANVETLKARWFVSRVERHAALTGAPRTVHLDEQIATLLAWAKADAELHRERLPNSRSAEGFFADIERWIVEERDAERQSQMKRAVNDGILRWLETYDLAQQPQAVRRALALVIAEGLNEGVKVASLRGGRSEDEQARLQANGKLLIESWVLAQAETYAATATAERAAFIDARLDEVTRWNVLQLLSDNAPASGGNLAQQLPQLAAQMEQWIARAAPQQREQLQQFSSDVQSRVLLHVLEAFRRPQ